MYLCLHIFWLLNDVIVGELYSASPTDCMVLIPQFDSAEDNVALHSDDVALLPSLKAGLAVNTKHSSGVITCQQSTSMTHVPIRLPRGQNKYDNHYNTSSSRPRHNAEDVKPDACLGYAIFTCLCCFCPLGLAAFIASIMCGRAKKAGDVNKAYRLAHITKILAHIAFVIGFFFLVTLLSFIIFAHI